MPSGPLPATVIPRRVSLVSQTVESLRAHLRTGHWTQRLPAERELCQQLQVSRPTVRAALQELQREGVIALTGRTRRGTTARHAPSRRGSRSRVVALLLPKPLQSMTPTALFMLDTLRDKLTGAGYAFHLHVDPIGFSARPARSLEKLVQLDPAAIWVAWGSKAPMQQWCVRQGVPLLVIGSCGPGIALPSVDLDFRAACRHAGELLWRKGHRRFALVLPQDAYDGDVESEHGFQEALGHHPEAQLRVLRHDGSPAHICSLLDRTLRSASPPTGYLVVRAVHALTVAMHLLRRQVRLPEDAAVLCRDDESYLQHTSPALTRYTVNPEHYARKVAQAVREMAETGWLAPRPIRLMPHLIAGETV